MNPHVKDSTEGESAVASSTPSRADARQQLLIKTYDTLRVEIEGFIRELGYLAIYGALGTGAVWSWVLVNIFVHSSDLRNLDPLGTKFLLCVPPALALFFGFRFYSIRSAIHKASDFIAGIEDEFGLDCRRGWDTFNRHGRHPQKCPICSQQRRFGILNWANVLDGWAFTYWGFMFAINSAASWFAIRIVSKLLTPD